MSTDFAVVPMQSAVQRLVELLRPEEVNELQQFGEGSVYTPYVTVFAMIWQRLQGNASLQEAIAALKSTDWVRAHPRLAQRELSANSGGFSRARTRLKVQVAEDFSDRVFTALQSSAPAAWRGRQAFILDGTTLSLTSHGALRKAFPPALNQHGPGVWPIVLCVVAHELSSGCALRPQIGTMYGSKSTGEVALALELLPRIPERSVLLADRNFGVFAFVHAAYAAGHDIVTRLTESRYRALLRRAHLIDRGVWELDWRPTASDRKSHPQLPADAQVTIRLHAVPGYHEEGTEITLWIATTLDVTSAEVGEFYQRRQQVETDIRDVKVALKIRELRGQSAEMIRKEIALGMVAYNLVVQVRRLAATRARLPPRRLSFSGTWAQVKALILLQPWRDQTQLDTQFQSLMTSCLQCKLPNRPGRKYPRAVLPKGRTFPVRKPIPPPAPDM